MVQALLVALPARGLAAGDVLTAPEFTALKRRVLGLIREEAMRALAETEPLASVR